jgi:hypothetical protein
MKQQQIDKEKKHWHKIELFSKSFGSVLEEQEYTYKLICQKYGKILLSEDTKSNQHAITQKNISLTQKFYQFFGCKHGIAVCLWVQMK